MAERVEIMGNRELLELAAKAAGYMVNANKQAERDALGYGDVGLWIDSVSTCWNPLNDDGDYSRLEAALAMDVVWFKDGVGVGDSYEAFADHDEERQVARRLAGTREAASMVGRCRDNP